MDNSGFLELEDQNAASAITQSSTLQPSGPNCEQVVSSGQTGVNANVVNATEINTFITSTMHSLTNPGDKPLGSFHVPNKLLSFVGRKGELKQLKRILRKGNYAVIHGMGGAGKTSISVKYLIKTCRKPKTPSWFPWQGIRYLNLIWIDAETTLGMVERFRLLGTKLGIKFHNKNSKLDQITRGDVEEIYRTLSLHPSILVFDNAESYEDNGERCDGIRHFLPPSVTPSGFPPKVIITTRNTEGWDSICRTGDIIHVDNFSESDCKTYILNALKKETVPDVETNWKLLSNYYDSWPIALESACGHIKTFATRKLLLKGYAISDFIQEFGSDELHLSSKVENLWEKTFEKLEQDYSRNGFNALQILNVLSFFSSDGLPAKFLLTTLFRMNGASKFSAFVTEVAEPAVKLLESLSLLKRTGDVLKLHRLLQQTRMNYMKAKGQDLDLAIDIVRNVYVIRELNAVEKQNILVFGQKIQRLMDHDELLYGLVENLFIIREFSSVSGYKAHTRIYENIGRNESTSSYLKRIIRIEFLQHLRKHGLYDEASSVFNVNLLSRTPLNQQPFLHNRSSLVNFNRQLEGLAETLSEPENLLTSELCRIKDEFLNEDLNDVDHFLAVLFMIEEFLHHYYSSGCITEKSGKILCEALARREEVFEADPDDERTWALLKLVALTVMNRTVWYDKILSTLRKHLDPSKLLLLAARRQVICSNSRYVAASWWLRTVGWSWNMVIQELQDDWKCLQDELGIANPLTVATALNLFWLMSLTEQENTIDLLEDYWTILVAVLIPGDVRCVAVRDELIEQMFLQDQEIKVIELLSLDLQLHRNTFGNHDNRTIATRDELFQELWRQGKQQAAVQLIVDDCKHSCNHSAGLGSSSAAQNPLIGEQSTFQEYYLQYLTAKLNERMTEWNEKSWNSTKNLGRTEQWFSYLMRIQDNILETSVTVRSFSVESVLSTLRTGWTLYNNDLQHWHWSQEYLLMLLEVTRAYGKCMVERLVELRTTWSQRKAKLGLDDPLTIKTLSELFDELLRQDKVKDAYLLMSNEWVRQKETLGDEDPRTLATEHILSSTKTYLGPRILINLLARLLENWASAIGAFGGDDFRTIHIRNTLFHAIRQNWFERIVMHSLDEYFPSSDLHIDGLYDPTAYCESVAYKKLCNDPNIKSLLFLRPLNRICQDRSDQSIHEVWAVLRKEIHVSSEHTNFRHELVKLVCSKYHHGSSAFLVDWLSDLQRDPAFGYDHSLTIQIRDQLAREMGRIRSKDKLAILLNNEFRRQQNTYGADHPLTLATRDRLINAMYDPHNPNRTLQFLNMELNRQREALPMDDPNTSSTLDILTEKLLSCKQIEAALSLLADDWELVRKNLGPDHSRTLNTRDRLVQEFSFNGKSEYAFKLLNDELSRQLEELSESDERYMNTLFLFAEQLWLDFQSLEALQVLQMYYLRARRLNGPDSLFAILIRNKITDHLTWNGDFMEAVRVLNNDHVRQINELAADDVRTVATFQRIEFLRMRRKYHKAHAYPFELRHKYNFPLPLDNLNDCKADLLRAIRYSQ